jgi:hypothetical protein
MRKLQITDCRLPPAELRKHPIPLLCSLGVLGGVSLLTLGGWTSPAFAQSYVLKSVALDQGGERLSAAGYNADMSLAQDFASGWITNTGYRAIIGFWHGPYGSAGIEAGKTWRPDEPLEFRFSRCAPNPFARRTHFSYSLPVAAEVRINVYDHLGQRVGALLNGRQAAGSYDLTWSIDAASRRALPSGVYFLRLEAAGCGVVDKLIVSQ